MWKLVSKLDDIRNLPNWFIDCHSFPVKKESIKEILCPKCTEIRRKKMYESKNMHDKINAGYYKDFPEKFATDAIEFVGLTGHPKADKAYSYAYDRGHSSGHGETLSYLEELVDLIK